MPCTDDIDFRIVFTLNLGNRKKRPVVKYDADCVYIYLDAMCFSVWK